MTAKVAINGFGRMGRLAMRAAYDRKNIEICHINEIKGGANTAAHLLEYDSVHGRWPKAIGSDDGSIHIDNSRIVFTDSSDLSAVPWRDSGADIVLECTGKHLTTDTLNRYFDVGVKKVIVSAPVKQGALNIVYGVNDHLYRPAEHNLLTAASCTTNCLAPVIQVIHEGLGIQHGVITTIHDVTNTQVMVDSPHKDLRRARSGLTSLVPTSTGSATAITMIYPELKGKLNGIAVRVPLLNASLTDCVFEVSRPTTVEEVNAMFKDAAKTKLRGILGFEEKPLVSVDFVNDPRSSIIDGPSTMVVDGTCVKVLAWYDNEWGYVNRMIDLTDKIAQSL